MGRCLEVGSKPQCDWFSSAAKRGGPLFSLMDKLPNPAVNGGCDQKSALNSECIKNAANTRNVFLHGRILPGLSCEQTRGRTARCEVICGFCLENVMNTWNFYGFHKGSINLRKHCTVWSGWLCLGNKDVWKGAWRSGDLWISYGKGNELVKTWIFDRFP